MYYFGFYFFFFIFIGSFFCLNLFTGMVQLNFSIAEEKAKSKVVTKHQANWIEIQQLIIKSKADFALYV